LRRTKIVCTIGPASDDLAVLRELISAGLDVARLNMSHGSHAEHAARIANIRQVAAETGRHIAVMLDTKGPELRIGRFAAGPVVLAPGQNFTLTTRAVAGDQGQVQVNYDGFAHLVRPGARLLLDDGLIELKAVAVGATDVECRVVVGGILSDRKRVSIPGGKLDLPALSGDDERDLLFGVEHGVDLVAASFIRNAGDVDVIKSFLAHHGADIPVIAKVENGEGIDNLDSILQASDGLMVARGDLGVELPAEDVPIIQKQMIHECRRAGKPAITATQMLDSMMRVPSPTRAEVSDVANAVFDGTDALMLSGETASGRYPVESVATMARVALKAEIARHCDPPQELKPSTPGTSVTDAIGHATVQVADDLGASAIITVTKSGRTARMIARHRPRTRIIAVTSDISTARALNLVWGVTPVIGSGTENTEEVSRVAVDAAVRAGLIGPTDTVVITAGVPVGVVGSTNMITVRDMRLES